MLQQEYVKDMIPEALALFMAQPGIQNPAGGPGNQYFVSHHP